MHTKFGIWKNLESVSKDMCSCIYDLQDFKSLYEKESMPEEWEKFIKEGFKNIMGSFLELVKAMIYFGNKPYKIKANNFKELLKESEYYNTLPKGTRDLVDSLRLLRNQDSHGYDIPEFIGMYELFVYNENLFIDIVNHCKYLVEVQNCDDTKKADTTVRLDLGNLK